MSKKSKTTTLLTGTVFDDIARTQSAFNDSFQSRINDSISKTALLTGTVFDDIARTQSAFNDSFQSRINDSISKTALLAGTVFDDIARTQSAFNDSFQSRVNDSISKTALLAGTVFDDIARTQSAFNDSFQSRVNDSISKTALLTGTVFDDFTRTQSAFNNSFQSRINDSISKTTALLAGTVFNEIARTQSAFNNSFQSRINDSISKTTALLAGTVFNEIARTQYAFNDPFQSRINELISKATEEFAQTINRDNFIQPTADIVEKDLTDLTKDISTATIEDAQKASNLVAHKFNQIYATYETSINNSPLDVLTYEIQALKEVITELDKESKNKPNSKIARISSWIGQQVLNAFLCTLFSFLFFATPTQPAMNLPLTHREALKISRIYYQNYQTNEQLRIVIVKTTLNVRMKPNKNSLVIGKLYPYAGVLVEDKAKKWTKVLYHPKDSDCEISGWVTSKYLKKIK